MKKTLLATSLLTAVITTPIYAESFRQHDAHVHGVTEFNLAQDGHDLLVEIIAPGADIVGFEHAPQNDDQKRHLKDAIQQLNKGELLSFNNSAKCKLEATTVTHTLSQSEHKHHDHDKHEHHDHDKHEHHEHHDHDKHEHHDHDKHEHHDHDKHEHSGHGEFNIQYTYHCDAPQKLQLLTTTWFDTFNSEKIKFNVLTEKTQTASTLTAQQAQFRF